MTFPTQVTVTASDENGHKVTITVGGLTGIASAIDVERHQVLARRLFVHWHKAEPDAVSGRCLPATETATP